MTSARRNANGRRWRFSIRITLLAVTFCALAVAGWKAFIWQPPTHRIALYEKTPIYYGRTAKIGPNQIRIESVAIFPAALESVDHLEIRSLGGRHRFFFDGIQIPEIKSRAPFSAPPTAVALVGGKETTMSVPEFRPLDVRVRLIDGDFGSGSTTSNTSMSLIPNPDGPTDRGQTCSLIIDERGIGEVPFQFRFRRQGNPAWVTSLKSAGGAQSMGSSRVLIERDYQVPIGRIDEIEISVTPVP